MAGLLSGNLRDMSLIAWTILHRHPLLFSIVAFITIYVVYYFASYDKRRRHLPPQPPCLPFLNQTLYHMQEETITNAIQWARKYGELHYTKAGTMDFIWVNSPEAVKELIDRRSSTYSSRPPNPMAFGAASGGRRVVFMPYGKRWRTIRTIIHRLLTPNMAASYAPAQLYEAKQLSVDLLDQPQDIYNHNRRYTSSLILQITYGRRIPKWGVPEVLSIFEVLTRFGAVRRPGEWLVDSFPALAEFHPFDYLSSWRKVGAETFRKDSEVWLRFWDDMVKEIKQGTAPHSFGKGFVQSDWAKMGLDKLQAAYVLGTMIEAGSETTGIQLNNCVVGILSRGREVVERAHEELDRVIGQDRVPDFDDEENLPYIRAMVKEVMRWRVVNKIGTNHYAMEDGWYKDYFIPKGAIVMINSWAMQYDPKRYPDPEKYEPMRFINFRRSAAEAAVAQDPMERDHYGYGGGRRICPGMHVAERSLYLNIARLMWGFDLHLAKDEAGNDIPVDSTINGFVKGGLAIPKPFKCDIRVRSSHHEKILREEWRQAQINGVGLDKVVYQTESKYTEE